MGSVPLLKRQQPEKVKSRYSLFPAGPKLSGNHCFRMRGYKGTERQFYWRC